MAGCTARALLRWAPGRRGTPGKVAGWETFGPTVVNIGLVPDFRYVRFPPDVILRGVRWYLRFGLSSRDMAELLAGEASKWTTSRSAVGCSD